MAPPPPPPPGPPPPPLMSPLAASSSADPKGRSALLQSIRSGTKLKKTVTNDRSAPLVSANAKQNGTSSTATTIKSGSATIARSNGFAGLFADGMPKLKPTGRNIGPRQTNSLSSLNEPPKQNSHDVNSFSSINSPKANGSIPNMKMDVGRRTVDPKNRGPPPQPPITPHKSVLPTSVSEDRLCGGRHNRTGSTVSLPNGGGGTQLRLSSGGGRPKPKLAPKPPAPNPRAGKPPTRAHSMRAPASPPIVVLPTPTNGNVMGELASRGTLHASTDSLLRTVSARSRPLERPPPPPRPPPGVPPPPPLRSTATRGAPPVPPQPTSKPARALPATSVTDKKYDVRFEGLFHAVRDFPPPPAFRGVAKVYNSKTGKQPAPAPPSHLQLASRGWSRDYSTC